MAITPEQYPLLIAAPMIQDYVVDKDTGAPLSGGFVTFYHDNARTVLKDVYTQVGSPGAYTYIPLANPMRLTAVGTFADNNGNDIIPFYFPFEEDDDTILDPYFITVYSSNPNNTPAVLQFTRANFPFLNGSSINPDILGQQDLINLISNGQFTSHNNLPNNGLFPNGPNTLTVAQGGSIGWVFFKNNTSTSTDFVNFTTIDEEPGSLVGNPRYALNLICTASGSNDTFKELLYRFNNVNRFASTTQFYTFSFSGISNTANSVNVNFYIFKNFGTSGSASIQTFIQTFTIIPGEWTQFSTSFLFGNNDAFTIGPNNDDYVQIIISTPNNTILNISLTDFILTPGRVEFTSYPERPDNIVFADALVGSTPTPDFGGADLYLPVVITRAGAIFDHSGIGTIEASINDTPVNNQLLCNGQSFITSGTSTIGIPYSRLQAVLFTNGANNVPIFGTGTTFATAQVMNGLSSNIHLSTNQNGAQTLAADGSAATGFAFSGITAGLTSPMVGYANGNASAIMYEKVAGASTFNHISNSGAVFTGTVVGNGVGYTSSQIVCPAASIIPAGNSVVWRSISSAVQRYMWFTVDGSGSDPALGGTLDIRVNLLSTYSAIEVAACVKDAASGYAVSQIVCNAASTLTAGDFWTFNANGTTYSVYYTINGAGTAPVTGTPILVAVLSGDSASNVALKTVKAINSYSFALPDLRGMFLLGAGGTYYDTLSASRFSQINNFYGNQSGTFEQADTYVNSTNVIGIQANAGVNWYMRY